MKNLLYKELKLAVHPSMLVFMTFGVLLIIPQWPFFLAFGYFFIGILNSFYIGRTNQDIFFTASLPVKKSDVVLAKVASVCVFELMLIIVSVPFAIIHRSVNPGINLAGMEPNFAFFGLVFVMYAIFNAIFFTMFFKTAYKVGKAVLIATIAVLLFVGAVEFTVHGVPILNTNINAIGTGHLGSQLVVLLAGAAVYFVLNFIAYKKAAKNFDKVDL